MPSLAELTDQSPQQDNSLPVEHPYRGGNLGPLQPITSAPIGNTTAIVPSTDAVAQPDPNTVGTGQHIINKLLGLNGEERYQLWPEKVVRDALAAHLADDFYKKAMSGEDINHYNFGFVNHKGQFLDRGKALDYGIQQGLVDPQNGKYGVLTSTMLADSSKPGTAIEAMAKTNNLPASSSLAIPPAPTLENMRISKIEKVPLSLARATNKLEMEKFDKGQHPKPLIKGYDKYPIAVKKEDGEHLIFDGHHRIVKAIQKGDTHMDMHVIDAKTYAPEFAGRKPNNKQSMTDDELLAQLSDKYKLTPVDHNPFEANK